MIQTGAVGPDVTAITSNANLEELAERIARHAHADQTDKAGAPYIEHPARVAARLDTAELRAASWLHDVIEDTGLALDDVAGWGAVLAGVRRDTGGELSGEERGWADEVLGINRDRKASAAR